MLPQWLLVRKICFYERFVHDHCGQRLFCVARIKRAPREHWNSHRPKIIPSDSQMRCVEVVCRSRVRPTGDPERYGHVVSRERQWHRASNGFNTGKSSKLWNKSIEKLTLLFFVGITLGRQSEISSNDVTRIKSGLRRPKILKALYQQPRTG